MKEKRTNSNILRSNSGSTINITPARKAWAERNIDKETKKTLDEDAKYFLHQSMSTPCLNVLRKADGIYIEDLAGRKLMDFHGNNVHQAGFSNPKVIEAIKKQLDELSFCTRRYTNVPAIRLAKKLTELAPGNLNKVLFCPGGAEAVEMAMRLARVVTGRFKTVSMWDSFHGATIGTISIGGLEVHRGGMGPLLSGTEHVPPFECYRCPWGYEGQHTCDIECAKYVAYVLEKEGDISAVIAESIRNNTASLPPQAYWEIIRKACDKLGVLLVFDEIPTCFWRTGKMFAFQHYDVVPDMVAIGKSLGGGVFPLAAMIAREELDVMPNRSLGHFTHEKNPVAAAASLAAIAYIEENSLAQHVLALGEYALGQMREMMTRHRLIGDVRGRGLLMVMELVRDRTTKERASEEAEIIMYRAFEKGMAFKLSMGNIIYLCPALMITKEEMEKGLHILDECLTDVENK